ncbi:MAG: DUF523 and DUF1722 domain-containing protein [Candidatus Nitrosomaritimum aestuariumsis]
MIKPILGVSKCLEFDNCRYDGKLIGNDFVRRLKDHVDFVPVCPEVGIGLGSPRQPIRLVKINKEKNLYQPSTDENLTQKMKDFSKKFLEEHGVLDGFILKHSSPTCGVRNVKLYHKIGKAVGYDQTMGIFTELVIKKFPTIVVEDEARLRNPVLRDSFLTRMYTMTRLRESLTSKDFLLDFCKNNEMLFLCYDHAGPKRLIELLSSYSQKDFEQKFTALVFEILNKIPDSDSLYRTYAYIFSLLKDKLTVVEKDYFDVIQRDFSQSLVLPSQISTLLYSWALRFDIKSIISQTIFEPYPKKLVQEYSKNRDYSLLKL